MKPAPLQKGVSFKINKKWFINVNQGKSIQDVYDIPKKKSSKGLLGEGTYGNVYKATHKISKQVRAVKIIPKRKVKN